MEVKTLYTLMAVIDHRSFAEAAKAVGLSISGVSLQIKALEEEFGLTIFDRSTRPPQLTVAGHDFVKRAREVIDRWELLSESLRSDTEEGVLEIGAVPTIVSGVLPMALGRLRRKNPALQIRLTSALSHELEEPLLRGSLDAALVSQPPQLRPSLKWQPFGAEPLVVIAPKNGGGEEDRDILSGSPFIRFNRLAWVGRQIDDELRRRGIALQPRMEVDSLEGIFGLVANGLGVSVVPQRNLARPFPAGLKAVPFGKPQLTRTLGILQRQENPRAHLVAMLYQALKAASRPAEDIFNGTDASLEKSASDS